MIILDDLMSTSAKDSRINDLFTEGSRHRNLSVEPRNHPDCAQRSCISVKEIPRHKTERWRTTISPIHLKTIYRSHQKKTLPISSEDSEIQEYLIACRDCGVVFAHIRGLEAHSQQGCGKKNVIALPMTGKDVEDTSSGLPVTVCCADDLPTYVSDKPRTFVVNTDNCD
ncbi:unnamed protein product [Mytilus coruscus]|uniref:Uncharacterized protein n=1 Tax=Mytilus coruscus TaxID=42192 RepID=A0A6J8EVQ3_MYTCO|nr:unnamed protein product [Mytilus coruscus]